VVKFDLFF